MHDGLAPAEPHVTWLGLALLGLAWLALRCLYRRRALSRLPGISDDEFLRRFAQRFSAPPDPRYRASSPC